MPIRIARLSDAKQILEIYAPIILNSPISFETEVPSLADFKKRMSEVLKKYPWIVFEKEKKVVGYAYASQFRSRAAYQWSTEVSVYVHPDFQGQGVATKLYNKLFEILKGQSFVTAIAGITLPHPPSVKLHESLGFTKVGVFKSVGFKFGAWYDVGFWEKELQPLPNSPMGLKKS